MEKFDKWEPAIPPGAPVTAAAVEALQARLAAVRHYLPPAAKKSGPDPEDVHELRVWTRRAAAALELYAGLLPRRRSARLRKRLKRLRRAANDARDMDIFTLRLTEGPPGAGPWLDLAQEERQAAQRPLVKACRRLKKGKRLTRLGRKMLRRLKPPGHGEAVHFGDWARERLRPIVHDFFAAVPGDTENVEALHQFRVRGKQLRYAMELLAGAFPPAFRDELYPAVEELQERLGAINDHAAALARLGQWIETADGEKAFLQALLAAEAERLAHARREFEVWFTPRRREELRTGFERMLASEPVWSPGGAAG